MQILFPLDGLSDILTSDCVRSEKISSQIAPSPNIKSCKLHEKCYTTNSHEVMIDIVTIKKEREEVHIAR